MEKLNDARTLEQMMDRYKKFVLYGLFILCMGGTRLSFPSPVTSFSTPDISYETPLITISLLFWLFCCIFSLNKTQKKRNDDPQGFWE